MRDRDTLAEAGGAQLLTGKQAVENLRSGHAETTFEKHPGLFENTFLAARIQIKQDLVGSQNVV
ncbi:hypothetical protein SDC9_196204 [bioreactor metagenome]|uniref:Uncharacterized protein n=1 Tax=bioreactor metagenome TaxID=1076179 RepID=A0A645IJV4_9ZZZZ